MRNPKGKGMGWKVAVGILAVILLAYGYYGYVYVPSYSSFGAPPPCPFGHEGSGGLTFGLTPQNMQMGMGGGTCLFSFYALLLGIVLLIVLTALVISKR